MVQDNVEKKKGENARLAFAPAGWTKKYPGGTLRVENMLHVCVYVSSACFFFSSLTERLTSNSGDARCAG